MAISHLPRVREGRDSIPSEPIKYIALVGVNINSQPLLRSTFALGGLIMCVRFQQRRPED